MGRKHRIQLIDILLVEDNPGDADLAREALGKEQDVQRAAGC